MVLTLLAGAAAAALGSAQPHPARWLLTGGSGWAADPTPLAMTSGAAAALKTDDAGAAHAATQQEAGPGRLPTLGWNSWNFFKGRPRACPSACSADRASADGDLQGSWTRTSCAAQPRRWSRAGSRPRATATVRWPLLCAR